MLTYRILGGAWALGGVAGLGLGAIQIIEELRSDQTFDGASGVAALIMILFASLCLATGVGLSLSRSWSRLFARVSAILLALYCVAFVTLVGSEFGPIILCAGVLGVLFAAYTLFMVWRLRSNPIARETAHG